MSIDYSQDVPVQADQEFALIAELVQQQIKLEDRVTSLENQLEEAKEQLKDVQTRKLPDALRETGLSEVKLKTGEKLVVKDKIFANIKPEYEEIAFNWLKEHGFDDIIKNNVILTFKRGEDNLARQVSDQLIGLGLKDHLQQKKSVHWQTLRAFVTEQLESNSTIPHDVFGVAVIPTATIKRA